MSTKRIEVVCPCGTVIQTWVSQRRVYCSASCRNHYREMPHRPRVPLGERFGNLCGRADGCWQWSGYLDSSGRGKMKVEGRWIVASRVAWFLATGEWPTVEQPVNHTCDHPPCTRNDESGIYEIDGRAFPRRGHLWLADHLANNHDMIAKGRRVKPRAAQTHCKQGHPLSGDNLYQHKRQRVCRICSLEAQRRSQQRKKLPPQVT